MPQNDGGVDRRGLAHATLHRLCDLEADRPRQALAARAGEAAHRYECARRGELLHIDVKKFARFHRPGHRLLGRGPSCFETAATTSTCTSASTTTAASPNAELLPDERAESAISFLRRARDFFAARGLHCERLLTDNGSALIAGRYRDACRALGLLRHTRTRPRRPRTNGKAEHFIQTLLNELAYARLSADSEERARALPLCLNHHNDRRPHGSLGHRPSSRLNNVSRNYI